MADFDGSSKKYTSTELAEAADEDEDVMGLCVWSFPDTNVEDQYPCYLMALDPRRAPMNDLFRSRR